MGLPREVKISGFTYSIEYFLKDPNEPGLMGELIAGEDHIKVRSDLTKPRQVEVLLHEVLHALLSSQQLKDDLEERVVSVLSEGLIQFMQDNPQVIRDMLGMLNIR